VRTNITRHAGRNYLEAFWGPQDPNQATPETPNDYWELETEYVQESVWKNDLVEAQAALVSDSTTVIAIWRREIEAAMKGKQLDASGIEVAQAGGKTEGPLGMDHVAVAAFYPFQKKLYQDFLRDNDASETTRQVLSRVRTISVAYSAQAVAQARPTIYTTAQLVNAFAVPPLIAARLPADPTEIPTNTLWSWKQRRNTSRYEWSGRVSEVMSWTFAAWSTNTHQLFAG